MYICLKILDATQQSGENKHRNISLPSSGTESKQNKKPALLTVAILLSNPEDGGNNFIRKFAHLSHI
jgi:hypothetical protein